jgi:pimeloyl-ACP methyl ester carboxylesterase
MTSHRILEFDTVRIAVHGHLERLADLPAALLVHGFPLDHHMWDPLLQADGPADRALVAVDLRGHGDSPWAGDEVHSMELLADDLASVVERLDLGPVDLVGLSMGGYVALAFCERHPELVRTLGLVDTRAGADGPEAREGRDRMIADVASNGMTWLADTMLPKLVAPGAHERVRAAIRGMIEGQSFETVAADLRGMRERSDRSGILSGIEAPVAVVVGEEDAITPPVAARAMAEELADVRLRLVPGAGHMTPMERPDEVRQALADLWAGAR